jgi:hypothetical protein
MKKLIILPALLALAGCMSVGPALELAGGIYNKINANVEQAARQLTENCRLLQATIVIGGDQLKGAKIRNAVATGEQALADYCTGAPPVDVPTALATVARIYRNLINAKAAAAGASTSIGAVP